MRNLLHNSLFRSATLALLLFFSCGGWLAAQSTNSSPQIKCISVDSVGTSATLTWSVPSNINGNFLNYEVFYSYTINGPWILGQTIGISAQNSCTLTGLTANVPVYFYIVTDTNGPGNSPAYDTLSSINLIAVSSNGLAQLRWNPIYPPSGLPTSTGWYKIYKEYPQYVWTLIDSTKSLKYTDTITTCGAWINYQVEIADTSSAGCISSSNWAGANFSALIPSAPIMDTVSVNGKYNITITWSKSSRNDVIGYYLYVQNVAGAWILTDTINGINNTSFTATIYNTDSASVGFKVAAFDSCLSAGNNTGTISNPQQTIWLHETKDVCERTNTLTWNKYINLVPGVKSYEVFASINGGPYTIIGTTSANETTFIDTTITFTQNKTYYIRVVDSTRKDTTASSNVVSCSFITAFLPRYFYLNDATALNNTSNVAVQCYVDTSSGLKYYELIRAYNSGGPYSIVGTVNAPLHQSFVTYIDTANPNIQSYYYNVIGLDSCEKNVDTSNLGKTIYLTALGKPNSINHLTWNAYQDWLTGVSNYLVYRAEDNGPYSLVGSMPGGVAGEYIFDDNVTNIIMGYGVFSYYVKAIENPSVYPFMDTSASNIAEAYQDPNVYIPNAFDPKGINKVFIPVGKFVDVQGYDFTILDRWGNVLFESNDPNIGWNGMYKGKIAQEDVYVYLLTYTSNKGEYFQRKGTVTLLK